MKLWIYINMPGGSWYYNRMRTWVSRHKLNRYAMAREKDGAEGKKKKEMVEFRKTFGLLEEIIDSVQM